jgi:RNA dependent RNA polymerase
LFNSGFELTKDPFFNGVQQTLRQRGLINLKLKSNILVKKAARLLGVLDEYGVLAENEVFVQIQGEIPIGEKSEVNTFITDF